VAGADAMSLIAPTIADAIRELEREQTQRDRVFPRWVAEGKLKQHDAEWRRECLDVAIDALRGLARPKPGEAGKPRC
jgi:hypothetical protein